MDFNRILTNQGNIGSESYLEHYCVGSIWEILEAKYLNSSVLPEGSSSWTWLEYLDCESAGNWESDFLSHDLNAFYFLINSPCYNVVSQKLEATDQVW